MFLGVHQTHHTPATEAQYEGKSSDLSDQCKAVQSAEGHDTAAQHVDAPPAGQSGHCVSAELCPVLVELGFSSDDYVSVKITGRS